MEFSFSQIGKLWVRHAKNNRNTTRNAFSITNWSPLHSARLGKFVSKKWSHQGPRALAFALHLQFQHLDPRLRVSSHPNKQNPRPQRNKECRTESRATRFPIELQKRVFGAMCPEYSHTLDTLCAQARHILNFRYS